MKTLELHPVVHLESLVQIKPAPVGARFRSVTVDQHSPLLEHNQSLNLGGQRIIETDIAAYFTAYACALTLRCSVDFILVIEHLERQLFILRDVDEDEVLPHEKQLTTLEDEIPIHSAEGPKAHTQISDKVCILCQIVFNREMTPRSGR